MDATYISSNKFSVSGDVTGIFVSGRRLKLDCGVDGVKYCTVLISNFSSPNTVVIIKENELTSNLSTVLYGVVEPGNIGSLPDHIHSTSEGTGGPLEFIGLVDTPTTYSGMNDKYLRTTLSGLEFVSKTDIITPTKGIQTIKCEYASVSGVYVNPGVVYINDGSQESFHYVESRFEKTGNFNSNTWYYIYATTSGTTLNSNNIQFSTTEPTLDRDRYGYYHTTSSGWRCVGFFLTNPSDTDVVPYAIDGQHYVFFKSQQSLAWSSVSSGILVSQKVPLPNLIVDVNARVYLNSYCVSYLYHSSDTAYTKIVGVNRSDSSEAMANVFAVSDSNKKVGLRASTYPIQAAMNTGGFIIPYEIYNGAGNALTVTDPALIAIYEGMQSIGIKYKDSDEIYIVPGKIEINGGLYKVTSQFSKQLTSLSASTWYYIYVKPPLVGSVVTSLQIEYSSSAPSEVGEVEGWYHSVYNDWRCIGAVYTDSGGSIIEFFVDGDYIGWDEGVHTNVRSTNIGTSSSPTQVIWDAVPKFSKRLAATFKTSSFNANSTMFYSIYSSGSSGTAVTNFHTSGRAKIDLAIVFCTSSQNGYVWEGTATSNLFTITQSGYFLPRSIYNR